MNEELTQYSEQLTPYIEEAQKRYDTNAGYRVRANYYEAYRKYEIDDKMVLYETFCGRGISCNPAAIFRYLLKDERFSDFTHVWVLEKNELTDAVAKEFEGNKHIKFIEPFKEEYFEYLSRAKYLINNCTWQRYFVKKEGQVVINTWHGIPLKSLGFDEPNGRISADNAVRNFLLSDYIISPVEYTTNHFRKSYQLEGIFEGKIIETGYPRIDETHHVDKENLAHLLHKCGVSYDPKKKLILYAPTWRGSNFRNPDIDIDEYDNFINTVYNNVDKNEYQVLFKPHHIVYKALADKGLLKDNFVPATIDTNSLLGATDILVSDYSSIFFDFLVTGRPIIFYVPDLSSYAQSRGLYFQIEDLPGPVSDSLDEVAYWIGNIDKYEAFFNAQKYTDAVNKYVYNDDGNVCKRVVDAVFFGDESNTISLKNDKIKILFHTDSILVNGISYSVLNLMNNLDYSKYDVTFHAIGSPAKITNYLDRINKEVRVLHRTSPSVIDVECDARSRYCLDNAVTEQDNPVVFPSEFYNSEFKRSFGDCKFDYLVNFSGFNAFWTYIYLSQKKPKHIIWMHSVMKKEYDRCVHGNYIFHRELDNIFKLYKYHDSYVSCSYTTMVENRNDLADEDNYNRFHFANNLINLERKTPDCYNMDICTVDGKKMFVFSTNSKSSYATLVPVPNEDDINFVTIGRLSPEKNHLNLIKGFARLYKENDKIRLYIIGDGPLREDTRKLIEKLKLSGKVILTGSLPDPFTLLRYCHCFVLSSLYEGLSMVLQEARAVNLPIIATDFPAVQDSIKPNGQLIIGMEEDDMYYGLKAFVDGKVPNEFKFDLDEFNREAISQFEASL
ncbi:MAG: CDP-glycerol glycerophosphotransferase family protein [Eubacterium sp.]